MGEAGHLRRPRPAGWRSRAWLAAVVAGLTLSAACSPVRVLTRSSPTALVGHERVEVAIDHERVRVDGLPRRDFLQVAEPGARRDLAGVERAVDDALVHGLARRLTATEVRPTLTDGVSAPASSGLAIVVVLRELELGAFEGGAATPSRLRARFRWYVDGELVDEIDVRARVDASIHASSARDRLGRCADVLASLAAGYMAAAGDDAGVAPPP